MEINALISEKPQAALVLFPFLAAEHKEAIPGVTKDVNIRAVLSIDRGEVLGGMTIHEAFKIRYQENGQPRTEELETLVRVDEALPDAVVFDILMYALQTHPVVGQKIVAALGYMPTVVPPVSLMQ